MAGTPELGPRANVSPGLEIGDSTVRVIVNALQAQPAYVLIFALFFIFASGAALYARTLPGAQALYVTLFGFLGAMIGAIVVVYIIVTGQTSQKATSQSTPQTGSSVFDGALSSMRESFAAIDKITYEPFRKVVEIETAQFQESLRNWGHGEIVIEERYSNVLIELYSGAETNIFSTSLPRYFDNWKSEFGANLLNAQTHCRAHGSVTRVFVFATKADVDNSMVEAMRLQEAMNIEIRVYYEDGNVKAEDFVMIDNGRAVGQTIFGDKALGARWYFDNPNIKTVYCAERDRLLQSSQPLKAAFPKP